MLKAKPLFVSILCLLCLSSITAVSTAKSQVSSSSISINADGSVEPSTAPIEVIGSVYTLTGNITGSVLVHRSNVVIDGAGYALQGDGGTGIDLTNNLTSYPSPNEICNVTIENLNILNFNYSINGDGSSYNTFYHDYIGSTTKNDENEVLVYWNRGGYNITQCTVAGTIGVELSNGNSITENNLSGMLLQLVGNETIDKTTGVIT